MNRSLQKKSAFIFKSVMWSLLFYFILMLAFNWDDVSVRITGRGAITNVNNAPSYRQASDANTQDPPPIKISGEGAAALLHSSYILMRLIGSL